MASASVSMKANLNELDAMLHDLSRGQYNSHVSADKDVPPERPPPPKGYTTNNENQNPTLQSNSSSNFLQVPKHHAPKAHSIRSNKSNYSETSSSMRRPRHPPKLQHVLHAKDKNFQGAENKGKTACQTHDLVKAVPKDYGHVEVPDSSDYDYYDYTATGGANSSYSNMFQEEQLEEVIQLPPPEAMEEVVEETDAGAAPRGEKSMVIHTDYGELKSKYKYLGFGLWENRNPIERPPPPRKPSPPPPPPKAEPIWYNCTVTTESHNTSKELDDLEQGLDGYGKMAKRDVELGNSSAGLPGCLGDIYEEFEKEDMSEMFRRAFLEQMGNIDEPDRAMFDCHVCGDKCRGRAITAMARHFHPECFVCNYCKGPFKDKSFKWSEEEEKPYCHRCFQKLLGFYGNAHF